MREQQWVITLIPVPFDVYSEWGDDEVNNIMTMQIEKKGGSFGVGLFKKMAKRDY